jgi:hypothetical protein
MCRVETQSSSPRRELHAPPDLAQRLERRERAALLGRARGPAQL